MHTAGTLGCSNPDSELSRGFNQQEKVICLVMVNEWKHTIFAVVFFLVHTLIQCVRYSTYST